MTAKDRSAADKPPLLAVGLLSAAALGYEVLLMRLLAIVAWQHFAFMIVSLALLGYGASGTLLSFIPSRAHQTFTHLFVSCAMGFSVSTVVCYAVAQRVPFNALEILLTSRQWILLAAMYLLLMVPFFFAGCSIGAGLRQFGEQIPGIYAVDLAGAGAGALAIIGLLFYQTPQAGLVVVAGLGAGAVLAGIAALRPPRRWCWTAAVGAWMLMATAWGADWVAPRLSEFKPLAQALRVPGARIVHEVYHPMGWIAVVQSAAAPARYAPGLSLLSDCLPPEQMAVFVDGQNAGAATRFEGNRSSLAYLRRTTGSLGYALRPQPERVLVVQAGAGGEVLRALCYGAVRIDAVETHPGFVELLRGPLADYAGWNDLVAPTRFHSIDIRDFLQTRPAPYTLIQLPLAGDADAGIAEDYLYTGPSLTALWRQLDVRGLMVMPVWVRLPPRATLKLVHTLARMLEDQGVVQPGRHLALIRDWRTAVLVLTRSPFNRFELAEIRRFCGANGFDLVYLPDLVPAESSRFITSADPSLAGGVAALLGPGRAAFVQRYKFDLTPPTDDRPFFGHSLRWRSLPELTALYETGGLGLLEWDYPLRWATLVQASLFSLLLMLLPLRIGRRFSARPEDLRSQGTLTVFIYFASIGAAFLLIEIAYMQRLMRFVHHPVIAAAITLSAFLLGAGGGSGCAALLLKRGLACNGLRRWALAAAVLIGGLQLSGLPWLYTQCSGLAAGAKTMIALATLLPLTFAMGMPFALGLSGIAVARPGLIAWVWSLNGCASVISAVLAPLVAIHLGFSGVIVMGLGCYACAFGLPLPGGPAPEAGYGR